MAEPRSKAIAPNFLLAHDPGFRNTKHRDVLFLDPTFRKGHNTMPSPPSMPPYHSIDARSHQVEQHMEDLPS